MWSIAIPMMCLYEEIVFALKPGHREGWDMKTISFTRGSLSLDPSGIVTLSDGEDLQIHCKTGLLWVTVEGDERDYWLKSGESVKIRSAGRVVIEAGQKSEVQMRRSRNGYSVSMPANTFC